MKKIKNTSILEKIAQEVWAESSLDRSKSILLDFITSSKMKSKDDIVRNVQGIKSKYKLDYYVANSLLYFEGHSLNK